MQKILIEKSLPYSFPAEKMILNCLLLHPESIETTTKVLSGDHFYFKKHQEIYKAILFMYRNELPIDIFSLLIFLQNNGLLEKIGGIKNLVELISQIPNLVYLENYISLVKEKFLRRSLIKLGYELINTSYITNIAVEKILNDVEMKLFNLTTNLNLSTVSNSTELLNYIFFELKEASLKSVLPGLPSGFYDLDIITQGFQKSDLIILAGRPSTGKTALSLNIVLNIIKTVKLPVLFFSLEMSKEQIMYRLLSIETNIPQTKLRSGKLSEEDWIKLNKIIKLLSKLPVFIDDTSKLSIQDVRSKIKTIFLEQSQLGLVVIDYLQLLENSTSSNYSRVQELSQITRTLKTIAREFNVPIITLSQLNRNTENRLDKTPLLSDLRESGSIEQDSDLVLMLYRKQDFNAQQNYKQESFNVELILAKHRNGPTGVIKLKFSPQDNKFFNSIE